MGPQRVEKRTVPDTEKITGSSKEQLYEDLRMLASTFLSIRLHTRS